MLDCVRIGPNLMTGVHTKGGNFKHTSTWGKHHVTSEAEIEMVYLQVKECQGLLATTDARNDSPLGFSEGPTDPLILGFWPPEL